MKKKVFRVRAVGGLGDVVLTTPAFRAIKEQYPSSKLIVFCEHEAKRDMLTHNPYIDDLRSVAIWKNLFYYLKYYLKWGKFYTFFPNSLYPSVFSDKNMKEIIAESFGVQLSDDQVSIYLTGEEEQAAQKQLTAYKNPVIIHITSRCSKNQEWPLENWSQLVKEMPENTFLQIGMPDEECVPGTIDLRGKTSFREAAALIKSARSFVGINSVFSHVTNAFLTPGVVLFGASQPDIWGHSNNINLYIPERCSPCIDLLRGSKCPYGTPCMKNISVRDVVTALRQQLSKHVG